MINKLRGNLNHYSSSFLFKIKKKIMKINLNLFGSSLEKIIKKNLRTTLQNESKIKKKYRIILSSFNVNKIFYNDIKIQFMYFIIGICLLLLLWNLYSVLLFIYSELGIIPVVGVFCVIFIPFLYLYRSILEELKECWEVLKIT